MVLNAWVTETHQQAAGKMGRRRPAEAVAPPNAKLIEIEAAQAIKFGAEGCRSGRRGGRPLRAFGAVDGGHRGLTRPPLRQADL